MQNFEVSFQIQLHMIRLFSEFQRRNDNLYQQVLSLHFHYTIFSFGITKYRACVNGYSCSKIGSPSLFNITFPSRLFLDPVFQLRYLLSPLLLEIWVKFHWLPTIGAMFTRGYMGLPVFIHKATLFTPKILQAHSSFQQPLLLSETDFEVLNFILFFLR